ncbi:MAG TPA: hypothetical protein VMQ93_16510, partial [Novosphingobium sp.]|nr:hypothetical protein [Novosphingobium sp.]
QTLWRALPAMMAGQTPRSPNRLAEGSYYAGRRPEDGRIDWTRPAAEVYNLIRAVAPPYPGAFTEINGQRFIVAQARRPLPGAAPLVPAGAAIGLQVRDGDVVGLCGDGGLVLVTQLLAQDGSAVTPQALARHLQPEQSNEGNR